MNKVLVAGGTGYLGSHIVNELLSRNLNTVMIVRDKKRVNRNSRFLKIIEARVTEPESLEGVFEGIDTVFSTVGITRQKDGLKYMDVDYQANANLIDAAKKANVKKFVYVSVLNGEQLRNIKICEAKERLVDYLKASGLEYCIIRPNGFFSDMKDFLSMAGKGRIFLFGDGKLKLNPIDGADLAEAIVNAAEEDIKEMDIGGPDMLSQNEIAELAFEACSKPVKITHLPDWIRKTALFLLKTFTSSKVYGPMEFFMTTMVMSMEAPLYGKRHLSDFFKEKQAE